MENNGITINRDFCLRLMPKAVARHECVEYQFCDASKKKDELLRQLFLCFAAVTLAGVKARPPKDRADKDRSKP
jgi:hypothetical protein